MTMNELAARLTLAAEDLAGMRAELAAESGFAVSGSSPGQRLAVHLNAAWQSRQDLLAQASGSLAELAEHVSLASQRYAASDSFAANLSRGVDNADATTSTSTEVGAPWTR